MRENVYMKPGTVVTGNPQKIAEREREQQHTIEYYKKHHPEIPVEKHPPVRIPLRADEEAEVLGSGNYSYRLKLADGSLRDVGMFDVIAKNWNVEKPASFTLTTRELCGVDPCYAGPHAGIVVKNARIGLWHAKRDYEKNMFGSETAPRRIWAFHECLPLPPAITALKIGQDWLFKGHVDVDSGQLGFFDAATVPMRRGGQNEDWYDRCCASTLSHSYPEYRDEDGQVRSMAVPSGVVTGTNYGDGGYPLYVKEMDGEVVAVMIDTCPDEENE